MDWYVEVELAGELDDWQLEQAAQDTTMARYNSQTRLLTVRARVAAPDYRQALDAAAAWLAGLPGITALRTAGVLGDPRGISVQSDEAYAQGLDLLGPAEVAARLGVSTARVRQLEERPDWPTPVADLAGGKIYRATDIDAFDRGWNRRPGRPTKQAG